MPASTTTKKTPSKEQVERLVRRKGYRLERLGSYTIPEEALQLQQELVKVRVALDMVMALSAPNVSHDKDIGFSCKRATILQLKVMERTIEQKLKEVYLCPRK